MILRFMAYGIVVASLFGLAALATERAFAVGKLPRRVLWAASLIASLAFPTMMALTPHKMPEAIPQISVLYVPSVAEPQDPELSTATRVASERRVAAEPVAKPRSSWRGVPDLDPFLMRAWIGSSLGFLAFYVMGWLCLTRMARHWPREQLDGASVRVANEMGPAVLGYLRPRIVVPRWVLTAPPSVRAMLLAHEREHIAGHDPLLLLGALLGVALEPWNLPLWWHLRRLRFAMEVDCDARVLRGGTEARAYGEMLLAVSQHRMRIPLGAMALTEPVSQLERRIRVLVDAPYRGGRWVTGAGIALAASLLATAAQVTAPALKLSADLRKLPPEDIRPGAQWARDAARVRFPELFDNRFDGTAVITFVFDPNGAVLLADKKMFPADSAPSGFNEVEAAKAAGAEGSNIAYGSAEDALTIGPWLESENPNRIDIVYAVLKWPVGPARSEARVLAAVHAHLPELFHGEAANDGARVAVFMNDDGTVNRADSEVFTPGYHTGLDFDGLERFTALGIKPDQMGRHGTILERRIIIGYAWPRRTDDAPDDSPQPHAVLRERADQAWTGVIKTDDADDRAIVERYFSDDASRIPLRAGERRWILFGRDGRVWAIGRGFDEGSRLLTGEIEARFPGIKVSASTQPTLNNVNCLGATPAERQRLHVLCVWLAADSPITDQSKVDLSRRPDVFLAAELETDLGAHIRMPVSLNFGTWAAWYGVDCTIYRLLGPCDLRFAAHDGGGNQVELTVGQQSPGEKDITLVPEGTVRVSYGGEETVRFTDREGHSLRIKLRPIRLGLTSGNSAQASGEAASRAEPALEALQWSDVGASAQCRDGTYSHDHRRNARPCVDHGGVRKWLQGRDQVLLR